MKTVEKINASIPLKLVDDARTLAIIRGQNFSEFVSALFKVAVEQNAAVIKKFRDEQKRAQDTLTPIEKLNL